MLNTNSNGEVYGSKLFTLAAIAVSAAILAGTIYSPAPVPAAKASPSIAHVVAKTPAATPVSG